MFPAVPLILYLGFCLASPIIVCGGRIIGGYDIPIEDVPYQVSIETNGFHQCGGSIISPKFIITAAHCTFHYESDSGITLAVRAGTSTLESGGQLVNVRTNNVHPQWTPNTFDYDFAILELEEELVLSDTIATIALPSPSQSLTAGTGVLVTGWGRTDTNTIELPTNLQGVTINLFDQATCTSYFPDSITDRMFCAGTSAGGVVPCSADSGGPLQADGVLLGVVSWSVGCIETYRPAVFTNVAVLLDYVEEITGLGTE